MLTRFLARLLGLWMVLTVVGLLAEKQAMISMLDAFFADAALMWITGVFTFLLGLAVVLAHNRWSGGAATIIVTVYGWIALIKGLMFVWLPAPLEIAFYRTLQLDRFYYEYLVLALVVGGYLIYAGFKPEAAASTSGAAG
jgi:hypothetical protein